MSSTSRTIIFAGIVTSLTAFVGYALYFDYKRRNDVEFRKTLRKQQKKISKSMASKKTTDKIEISQVQLLQEVRTIKKEVFPTSAEEREKYFSLQVNQAEIMQHQGEELAAALHFYRALCVYPNPTGLIQLYQQAIAPSIFKLLVELWTLGATDAMLNNDLGSPESRPKTPSGPSSETSSQEWENLLDSNLRI